MKVSLKYKFAVGLLLIFCSGYTVMSFFINSMIIANNKNIIKKEMASLQKDLTSYLKQYCELQKADLNSYFFEKNAKDITVELADKIGDRIIMYSNKAVFLQDSAGMNGKLINYTEGDNIGKTDNIDLSFSVRGKSAFYISHVGENYIAIFSFPVLIDGKMIGIIRCTRDCSDIFISGANLLRLINLSVLIAFSVIFMFVLILVSKITRPIISLSKVTKNISEFDFDTIIDIKSKDEIADLAGNFDRMRTQIKKQIERIKSDRDRLIKLEGHRKAFFDSITHEMKTPLTIISGYSQLIINNDFKDKELIVKAIHKIKEESETMYEMILEALEVSKLESEIDNKDMERVDVSGLLKDVCNDMAVKADKYKITIEKDIEENVILEGIAAELKRVFINLIDNSIKYGNVSSVIDIKLRQERDSCIVSVQDKGRGIPEEKLNRIFEPFYRSDNKSREKGSFGLGLSIVKKIVDKHNGQVYIKSEYGKGTIVTINFPLKVYNTEISV